ncbi:MAG: hypothetical protein PHD46_03375 [Eubacteriales bacterium]|nr:hypothetical protein [Eubacteriales bacterium]
MRSIVSRLGKNVSFINSISAEIINGAIKVSARFLKNAESNREKHTVIKTELTKAGQIFLKRQRCMKFNASAVEGGDMNVNIYWYRLPLQSGI